MTDEEYPTELLFEFEHPKHGKYAVWYDPLMKTYGITNSGLAPWCAYATLADLFKARGF